MSDQKFKEEKLNELMKECLKLIQTPYAKCIKKIGKAELLPIDELNVTQTLLILYIVRSFQSLKICKELTTGEREEIVKDFCISILEMFSATNSGEKV